MGILPILSAMRRNKFGAILIAAQMAVTLAFLANALTLIEHRLAWSARPTGVDEANVFVMSTESTDHVGDPAARQATDLAALRSLGGVVDVYPTNDFPLQGGGWAETDIAAYGPIVGGELMQLGFTANENKPKRNKNANANANARSSNLRGFAIPGFFFMSPPARRISERLTERDS